MKKAPVRRAMVRSRAQLDYQSTQAGFDAGNPAEPLMALAELGRLRIEREAARGGVSLPVPEQRVVPADGGGGSSSVRCQMWNAGTPTSHWRPEWRRGG